VAQKASRIKKPAGAKSQPDQKASRIKKPAGSKSQPEQKASRNKKPAGTKSQPEQKASRNYGQNRRAHAHALAVVRVNLPILRVSAPVIAACLPYPPNPPGASGPA
jgi:hypothetical protein